VPVIVPELSDIFAISVRTNSVVAICVELVASGAVTAVGVPVNAGLVDNTNNPVPVAVLVPVPPLAILNGVVKLNEVAVIVPVFNEVEEMFPDDTTVVAVIAPAANPPLPSRFTIVLIVFDAVADNTSDATVVIVDEFTPPTLLIVAVPVTSAVPLNDWLV
jgi:hypothetical protein